MLKLKNRIKEHIHKTTQLREMEKYVSDILHEESPEGPIYDLDKISLSTYENSAHLYIYFSSSPEDAEMNLLPKFNTIWSRRIINDAIVYYSSISLTPDRSVYITVYPQNMGTCRIIPKQTGRTVKERKTVEYEVPEIEYLIDCSDEGGDDN
jgi:hypothetical protein